MGDTRFGSVYTFLKANAQRVGEVRRSQRGKRRKLKDGCPKCVPRKTNKKPDCEQT